MSRILGYLIGGLAAGLGVAQTAQWEKAAAGNPTSSWLPFGPQDIIPPRPDRGW